MVNYANKGFKDRSVFPAFIPNTRDCGWQAFFQFSIHPVLIK